MEKQERNRWIVCIICFITAVIIWRFLLTNEILPFENSAQIVSKIVYVFYQLSLILPLYLALYFRKRQFFFRPPSVYKTRIRLISILLMIIPILFLATVIRIMMS